jgi:mono/diheme cytochrome c family protein
MLGAMFRNLALPTALPLLLTALALSAPAAPSPKRVEYNRDIRPILSENCLYCHGQDPKNRKAGLRLDVREDALAPHDDGTAIVPGKPESSDLIARLASTDKDEVMPPPKSNRRVTPEQAALLRRWIAEGAEYQKHWAFVPPKRAALPELSAADSARVHNPIDRFVLARLEAEGLAPSPEAAPETWLRRVSLDLTGLPPTPDEIDAFIADARARGEAAYEAAVDRLLASPHFGERLAIDWLDAARYADTHGFNNDSARTMWRWRDWVIDAFNSNKPYDQFITEQLAGDLLPQATMEQKLATGFCRNHVINSEGGIIDEEYRVEYVSDRIRTMSMAWMGLTMECCRCHDHKYDPVTQRD